jgi:hypothetical protein
MVTVDHKKTLPFVMIGKIRVPMTDEEFDRLKARLESHVETNGVAHGFIRTLLEDGDV